MISLAAASLSDWLAPGSAAVGFCAQPIHATAHDPHTWRPVAVMIRCSNRRAAMCPSCADLYAADSWQHIHAGTCGGHQACLPPWRLSFLKVVCHTAASILR
ncbi:replication initiator [Mycobacterium hubeiense]|uniref:replication initiator n=1 Tax=Mycobacterium hubeiense TaxID=1867256 RepID=UPI0032AFE443